MSRPPPSAARAGFGEEQDERDTGRAGIGGMAGGEGGADRMKEAIGRAGAIDQGLEKRGEQRRHALGDGDGDGERDEDERATSANEEQSDEPERNGSSEPAPSDQLRSRSSGPAGTRTAIRTTSASSPAAVQSAWVGCAKNDSADTREGPAAADSGWTVECMSPEGPHVLPSRSRSSTGCHQLTARGCHGFRS